MRTDAFELHIRKKGDVQGRPTQESSLQIDRCPICRFMVDRDYQEAETEHLVRTFGEDHFRATGRKLKPTDTQPFNPPDDTIPPEPRGEFEIVGPGFAMAEPIIDDTDLVAGEGSGRNLDFSREDA